MTNHANKQSTGTKSWGFWLWLASVFLLMLVIAVLFTAWLVGNAYQGATRLSKEQARIIMSIADAPGIARTTVHSFLHPDEGTVLPQLVNRKEVELPQWTRHFPAQNDSGYLLFSGMDPDAKQAIVKLIRITNGETVASWLPDWSFINAQTVDRKHAPKGSADNLRAFHPVLLDDGDIIFNDQASLVRQSLCSAKPIWVLDETFHHSNELDENGTGVWVPSVAEDGFPYNPWLREKIRDDALAHVSLDGRLLERRSLVRILRDNGLEAKLLATSGLTVLEDPIHLNQIKVATQDTRYWHRGDLLLSARHMSMVFLYRPSTNKIIWRKTGPWMNQHSAEFVDDHRISVFDNNVVGGPALDFKKGQLLFVKPSDINQVMVYDFDTKEVTQPFATLLAEARPRTLTEGRARLLPDGGLFLEETNNGRQLRFTKDRLLWSRVNDYDDKRIGLVSWSRYLTAEEARIPLQALAKRKCLP